MRPGGFSPRSGGEHSQPKNREDEPFNEAGGILPPEWSAFRETPRRRRCFNEAGGILPPECPSTMMSGPPR